MEAVIWIGIAAIVVIAAVIAAIGRPGDGGTDRRGRGSRVRSAQAHAGRDGSMLRAGSYSTSGHSGGYVSSAWGADGGVSSCGGDSGGGSFGGSGFGGGGDGGGSCGGGGGGGF